MVPVLVGALVISLVAMPGEAGATLGEFLGVAGDAARWPPPVAVGRALVAQQPRCRRLRSAVHADPEVRGERVHELRHPLSTDDGEFRGSHDPAAIRVADDVVGDHDLGALAVQARESTPTDADMRCLEKTWDPNNGAIAARASWTSSPPPTPP